MKKIKKGGHKEKVKAKIIVDGVMRSVETSKNASLLETALKNDIDAPFACRAGVCSTCKAKIIEGEAEMIANHALEDYEVNSGFVLCCQAYPITKKITWTYDEAGHTPRAKG